MEESTERDRQRQGAPEPTPPAFGSNEWLVNEMYTRYLIDPASVDRDWWLLFADYQPSSRELAAHTKRRATRKKLINATQSVMQEEGLDATVESIAKVAGVSIPTFYNFYKSRNQLCVDAINELVLWPIVEKLDRDVKSRPMEEVISLITNGAQSQPSILRAALTGRLETDPDLAPWPRLIVVGNKAGRWQLSLKRPYDFIDQTARLIGDSQILTADDEAQAVVSALYATAMYLLDNLAHHRPIDTEMLARQTLAVYADRRLC